MHLVAARIAEHDVDGVVRRRFEDCRMAKDLAIHWSVEDGIDMAEELREILDGDLRSIAMIESDHCVTRPLRLASLLPPHCVNGDLGNENLRSVSRRILRLARECNAKSAAKIPVDGIERRDLAPNAVLIRGEEKIAGENARVLPEHEQSLRIAVVRECRLDVRSADERRRDRFTLRLAVLL